MGKRLGQAEDATTTKPTKTTILTKRPPAMIPIRIFRKPTVSLVRLPQTESLRPTFPPDSGVSMTMMDTHYTQLFVGKCWERGVTCIEWTVAFRDDKPFK